MAKPQTVRELVPPVSLGFESIRLVRKKWTDGEEFYSLEMVELLSDGNGHVKTRDKGFISLPMSPKLASFMETARKALLDDMKGQEKLPSP